MNTSLQHNLCERQATTVGVPHSDYNTKRNILDSLPVGFVRVRPWDPGRVRAIIRRRIGRPTYRRSYFYFRRPYFPDAEIFHFWNSVANIHRPWVTTFEHTVPLWDTSNREELRFGLKLARRDECRRLIAFSCAAFDSAVSKWHGLLPSTEADSLIAKTEILLPPQPIIYERTGESKRHPVFAFVGKEFYRKGGLEVLEAFDALYATGRRDWQAIVVGDLSSFGDYASQTDSGAKARAAQLLERLRPNLRHLPTPVPHNAVIDILRQADFYLLPTYADTFGYTVLEAQACGAVAVATDVGSLPEVVTAQTGLVIPLRDDLSANTLPRINVAQVKREFAIRVRDTVMRCLDMPLDRRASLRNSATAQLRRNHCPISHSTRLGSIYRIALEG